MESSKCVCLSLVGSVKFQANHDKQLYCYIIPEIVSSPNSNHLHIHMNASSELNILSKNKKYPVNEYYCFSTVLDQPVGKLGFNAVTQEMSYLMELSLYRQSQLEFF